MPTTTPRAHGQHPGERAPYPALLSPAVARADRCQHGCVPAEAKLQTRKTRSGRTRVGRLGRSLPSGAFLEARSRLTAQRRACVRAKPMTPFLHRSVTGRHIRNEMVLHPVPEIGSLSGGMRPPQGAVLRPRNRSELGRGKSTRTSSSPLLLCVAGAVAAFNVPATFRQPRIGETSRALHAPAAGHVGACCAHNGQKRLCAPMLL
jgi:hypothetical protein